MKNFKTTMKIDELLADERFKSYEERERYCGNKLFEYLNLTSTNRKYTFHQTVIYLLRSYSGLVTVTNKHTDTIIGYFFVEFKVRETDYDDFVLDVPKYNRLQSAKRAKDKWFKTQWSEHQVGILYICFSSTGTYIFDLCQIIDNGDFPKKKVYNAGMTTAIASEKVEKFGYFLDKSLGKHIDWTYTLEDYLDSLKTQKMRVEKNIEKITTTGSIF